MKLKETPCFRWLVGSRYREACNFCWAFKNNEHCSELFCWIRRAQPLLSLERKKLRLKEFKHERSIAFFIHNIKSTQCVFYVMLCILAYDVLDILIPYLFLLFKNWLQAAVLASLLSSIFIISMSMPTALGPRLQRTTPTPSFLSAEI